MAAVRRTSYGCWSIRRFWPDSPFPWTACLFPAAKEEGLASFFKKEQQPGDLLLAAVFAAALGLWLPGYLRLAGLLALAGAYGAGALINRRLAGHTGDTYGFASLMSEQMFLFFAVLIGFIRWMY